MKPTSTPANPQQRDIKKSAGLQTNRSSLASDSDLRQQMIATAAYYRAERRGFDVSNAESNWYAAEKEIDQMLYGSATDDEGIVRLEALLTEWDTQFEELEDRVAKAKAQTRAES